MCTEADKAPGFSSGCDGAKPRGQAHGRPLEFERRQELILDHLPEVRRIARRIHVRLPAHVLFDDLVHSGVVGLIDALEKFDPLQNVSFRAYAQFRIGGAILDSLRELDPSSRSLRNQARHIEQARSELIAMSGHVPSEPEIAAHLGLRLDRFQSILSQLHSMAAGARQGPSESTSQEEDRIAESNSMNEDPFQLCLRAEGSRMLRAGVESLSHRERQIIDIVFLRRKNHERSRKHR